VSGFGLRGAGFEELTDCKCSIVGVVLAICCCFDFLSDFLVVSGGDGRPAAAPHLQAGDGCHALCWLVGLVTRCIMCCAGWLLPGCWLG
jgi:hypothetical protein